jgi:hypothetical protein
MIRLRIAIASAVFPIRAYVWAMPERPSAELGSAAQAALVAFQRRLVMTSQPRGVAKQEPQLGILRGRLNSAFGKIRGCRIIAFFQGVLGRAPMRPTSMLLPHPMPPPESLAAGPFFLLVAGLAGLAELGFSGCPWISKVCADAGNAIAKIREQKVTTTRVFFTGPLNRELCGGWSTRKHVSKLLSRNYADNRKPAARSSAP